MRWNTFVVVTFWSILKKSLTKDDRFVIIGEAENRYVLLLYIASCRR